MNKLHENLRIIPINEWLSKKSIGRNGSVSMGLIKI